MRRFISFTLLSWMTACASAASAGNPIWERLPLPETAQERNLSCVYFVDAKHGWIVGSDGLCLATRDGGASWEVQTTGSRANLRCVRFRDAHEGWSCGDGDPKAPNPTKLGQPAHVVGVPVLPGGLRISGMITSKTAGTLLHTTDGGKTWKTFWIPTNFQIPWIEASTAPVLQVCNSGTELHPDGDIVRSRDEGKTWSIKRACHPLLAVQAVTGKRWVAVGSPGLGHAPGTENIGFPQGPRVLYSDDSGETWKVSKGSNAKDLSEFLRALAVEGKQTLLAVGDNGAILRSADAGVHWEKVRSPTTASLRGAVWCGPLSVVVGEKGTILLGTDDGKNWKEVFSDQTEEQGLNGVTTAGDYVIIVGEKGTALRAKISDLANRKEKTLR